MFDPQNHAPESKTSSYLCTPLEGSRIVLPNCDSSSSMEPKLWVNCFPVMSALVFQEAVDHMSRYGLSCLQQSGSDDGEECSTVSLSADCCCGNQLFISLETQSQLGPELDGDQDSMLCSFCLLPLQPHLPTRHSVNSYERVQALQEIFHSCHSFPKTSEPCFYLDGRYCRDCCRPCWCLTRKAAFHAEGLASAQLADQPGCCSWTLV